MKQLKGVPHVADENMMPNINTNVPSIMIGEKPAYMIIADAPFITAKQQGKYSCTFMISLLWPKLPTYIKVSCW